MFQDIAVSVASEGRGQGVGKAGGSVLQHVCGEVLGTSMHVLLSFLPRRDGVRSTLF
jgi:hypothetical protein